MSTIITPGMQRKGMSRAAFGTPMTCPYMVQGLSGKPEVCGASSWRFVEQLGPYRIRYRCKACGKTLIYEFSNNPGHPYEAYGKSKWQKIVELWKKGQATRGRKP